ncbi:hypothetical protein BGZ58_000875 [Dissophora ornata]|nr:hypothetical protein BGZ58_000875 [Dissophora ornata]
MSNPDNQQESATLSDHEEFIDEEQEDDEEAQSDQDYYDPQDDLAYFHDQKLRIEESWLEWERQTSVNNRQNGGFNHNYSIFQKPGSAKRRERRQRYTNNRADSGPSVASGSGSGSGAASGLIPSGSNTGSGVDNSSPAAAEKLRRLGNYRPALASSIVHSYSNLTWEATQAAREKRLAAKAALNGTGAGRTVCQLFYHVVNADSCWKEGFMKFFGASIPFKRLDPKSWRGEYIKRTKLLRRWEKGRGSNILIDPKIGQISKLWAEVDNRANEGWFLAGGLTEGVVARCNPLLGKVQKDAVFRMVHLINSEVTVMAIDRHRVLWGQTTGQVSLTTLAYAAAGQTFQTFVGFHHGPVSCVKLVPNHLGFVLTGGVDGVVRLWNVAKARCVLEFRTGSDMASNSRGRIDHICCDPGSRVIAGTSKGEIYVWEVDVNSIVAPASASASGVSTPTQSAATMNATPTATANDQGDVHGNMATSATLSRMVKLPEEFKGVGYLEVDFGMSNLGLILAQAVDSTVMHLYSVNTLAHVATLKSPAHFSPITAIHWDIPAYEKPMISPSNSSHSGAAHNLHGRHEMPSLLATGDHLGNICLWYLSDILKRWALQRKHRDHHTTQNLDEPMILEPICVLKGHDTRVTSLFVDKLVIVSGSTDGWAKAWNPVNGKLISVLNTGFIRGREVNNMNSSAVKCIVVNSLQCRGVLSIGGLIRSWDFSPEANLAKDKYRKHMAKKPIHYSAGPKNKIQNDIRHSLEETVSLKRLENQAKDRREQLHRRYNNLEGLNMVDMTDEEVVEYVMMLSKEQEDQEAVQIALEMQQIQEMEEELASKQGSQLESSNGGEGSSNSVLQSPWGTTRIQDDYVTEQELEEEEELVRRAIAMSMQDAEFSSGSSHHGDDFHHEQASVETKDHDSHGHTYQPLNWESGHVVDVDPMGGDDVERQEDQQIVESILRELEEDDERLGRDVKAENARDAWPSIGANSVAVTSSFVSSLSSSSLSSAHGLANENSMRDETPTKKMTWSMVARTNSESAVPAASNSQTGGEHQQATQSQPNKPSAIIKQYPRGASQEEIEDEDTQLARILSLSMVEK